ncbi:MAG: DUF4290 domain-containing protein [Cytophagaceae bacterium]
METTAEQNQDIILKEYGRNIQNIVKFILAIEDREKRSKYARTLIELMKQINPVMRDAQDSYQKLWDHLYIMSEFKLDVESPFPMPEVAVLGKKPMKVDYNTHQLYYKHYGKNIELLIGKAIEMENPEDKEAAIVYIARLMKRFYASWNKDNIEDELILEHLRKMSKNQLSIDLEKVKSGNLFDINIRDREPKENRERERERDTRSTGGHRKTNRRQGDNKRRNNN